MKKQSNQILSPENYIRQRARNIPVFKCLVNEDWEDAGMAHMTIARQHINRNITFCSYLVDLRCLGVKDTLYQFNVPEAEFDDYVDQLNAGLNMIEGDYDLLHNIIHAGWEYAEDIGFEPHKDFLSTTQYMLEEDTDEVPLIDIACGGENGKPLFIQGPFEDDAMANAIIRRLEKNVGTGNFEYVLGVNNPMSNSYNSDLEDDWSDEDEYKDDEGSDLESFYEEYEGNSFEENAEIFLQLTQFVESENEDDLADDTGWDIGAPGNEDYIDRVGVLADLLYDELVDFKTASDYISNWTSESSKYTITNEAYYRMLGLQHEDDISYEDMSFLTKEFDMAKLKEYVYEQWGDLPYVTLLELNDIDVLEERKAVIARMLAQYPDYALFKLEEKAIEIQEKKQDISALSYQSIFGDRTEITPYEYVEWQLLRLNYFISTSDMSGIECMYLFNQPEKFMDAHHQISMFVSMVIATRISVLRLHLLGE